MKRYLCILALAAMGLACAAGRSAAFETYSDQDYAAVLVGFVNEDGLVDYASLKEQRDRLDAYVVTLEMVDPKVYQEWTRNDQIAFWINAYNALTLRAIVDNHPITPQPGREVYPKNSIRQIPGVWDRRPAVVMGMKVTLDHIEHKILRADFKEPRIHMALVCAAVSCPPLRNEPYRGATLDAQLDDQSRRFLSDLRRFHVDRAKNEVWASEIFKWFVDDFLPGATAADENHVAERKSLAAFASKYVGEADREFLAGTGYVVRHFKYDWTLNEQKN